VRMKFTARALGASLLYLVAVILPNYLIAHYGVVDVVPGPWTLLAPAAVYAVGVALVARDVVDDVTGRAWYVIALIVLGTALSAAFAGPQTALASGAAFILSELLDLGVYRAVRARFGGWSAAALVSSYVGAVLDSLVFLWIAFGSLAFLPGQWVGKAVMVTAVVVVFGPLRRFWTTPRRQATADPVAM
jgi:queuosine precursor transporter